jgi:transglutaminase-like putative cysteine protease
MHMRRLKAALSATAAALELLLPAFAGQGGERGMHGTVFLAGQASGHYSETTKADANDLNDAVEQDFVLNRLGARVELSEKESYDQGADGHLIGGRAEVSSSKTPMITDYRVVDGKIAVETNSGGRNYKSEIPFTGSLSGPADVRRLLVGASQETPKIEYQAFEPSLDAVTKITLNYLGKETVDGLEARKFSETSSAMHGVSTLWADAQGYTVKVLMNSPFGAIEILRGDKADVAPVALPAESFERTLATANIKLPHPRQLQSVTVEITKAPGAESPWPDLAWPNQEILYKDDAHVVLQISQPYLAGPAVSVEPSAAESAPGTLVQSDDPEVVALSQTIVGNETDPWKKTLLLQSWVAKNMHFDAGIGEAPASELVRDRHGTCLGYAILLAALARAQNIPAHIRLGFVYDGGIWGGHAWTEVYVQRHWLPVDAAEYYPGVADAGRIGVATIGGEGGLEHLGDFGLLFGSKVRTIAFEIGGKTQAVPDSGQDHTVAADTYRNPWLGLTVQRPDGFAFQNLDDHWPHRDVLSLKSTSGEAYIAYLRSDTRPLREHLAQLKVDGQIRDVVWGHSPAIRIDAPDRSVIVAEKGDVLWAISARGADAKPLLDKVLALTEISELNNL